MLPNNAPLYTENRIGIHNLDSILNKLELNAATKLNDYLKAQAYTNQQIISNCYPSIWSIETTNICGQKCTHCPRTLHHTRDKGHMDIDLFKKILRETRTYAQHIYNTPGLLKFIHFGEPSLYRHLEESLAISHESGFKTCISSTASALTKQSIESFIRGRLASLWLMFDGMDDETFKNIRKPNGSFRTGMDNLKFLLRLRAQGVQIPNISVSMVRHPDNRHQWKHFQDFFGSIPGITTNLAHFSTYNAKYEELMELKKLILDDQEVLAEQNRTERLNEHVCYYPWHSMVVLWDGRVVPCCRDMNGEHVLGDLRKQSLIQIWNGEAMRELRREMLSGERKNSLCALCREGSLECGIPDEIYK